MNTLGIEDIERNCEATGFGEYDWYDLLDEITTWVGGDKALLLGAGAKGSLAQTMSFNHDQTALDRYNAGYNLHDPRKGHSKMTAVGQCGLGQQFVANDAIKNSAYFSDISEAGDIKDSVHGVIVDDPELGRHSISVQRGFAGEYFQSVEADRLSAILPMLGRAMRTSQRVLSLQNRPQHGSDPSYCLVRSDLAVHFIKETSVPLLTDSHIGISFSAAGWRFSQERMRSVFATAVNNAIKGKESEFSIRGVRFAFAPPPINLDWLVGNVPCALVSVGEHQTGVHASARLFANAHEFTPKETELLMAMVGETNLRSSAQAMKIEYETARWHLKNMCVKARYRSSQSLLKDARVGNLSRAL